MTLGAAASVVCAQSLDIEASVTAVALFPDDDRITEDRTASFDLTLDRATESGRWFAYVEANTSLNVNRASTILPEINADAGTALDPDRRGRVQLSELNYRLSLKEGASLTLGYLDPSGYLDRSRITNDENVQFLGVSFVNNPTIEFPDYTMGVVYQRPTQGRVPQLNVVVTSSSGLADNPNLSYAQLLEVSGGDKGIFAAVGTAWLNERGLVRVGAWINTRPHPTLVEPSRIQDSYGLYAVLGREWGPLGANLRIGLANDDVSQAQRFAGAALRWRIGSHALGLGLAETTLSDGARMPLLNNYRQIELFGRINLKENYHLTVSVQQLDNSSFVADPADARDRVTVAGVRFFYRF